MFVFVQKNLHMYVCTVYSSLGNVIFMLWLNASPSICLTVMLGIIAGLGFALVSRFWAYRFPLRCICCIFLVWVCSLMVASRLSWTPPTPAVVNANQKHAHDVYEPSLFLWDLLVCSHWFIEQVMQHMIQSRILWERELEVSGPSPGQSGRFGVLLLIHPSSSGMVCSSLPDPKLVVTRTCCHSAPWLLSYYSI